MKGFGLYLIILVFLLAGVSYVVSQTQQTEQITYSDVFDYFNEGEVDQFTLEGGTLTMHLRDSGRVVSYDIGSNVDIWWSQLGMTIDQQMKDGTLTQVDYITTTIPWWANFLPYVILIVLLIAFWYFMMNKQSGGGAGPMQFGKARARLAQDDKRKVTFNDVAGADEEKAELQEIVQLVGMDALSAPDRLKLEAARSIREDFLHQNAFDPVDTYTPLAKQHAMMALILRYYQESKQALEQGGIALQRQDTQPREPAAIMGDRGNELHRLKHRSPLRRDCDLQLQQSGEHILRPYLG